MTLLQPSYLWGLLALAIPIAIHLWSRKKVQIVLVGSTQFISETKSKQTNSIQINERWLLLLRCLIISMLVFILTEPQTSKTPSSQAILYVFEPSLLATEEGRSRFDEIPIDKRLLLNDGFSKWQEEDVFVTDTPNYWQLAKQMGAIQADSIVVFTRALAKGFKGKRPRLKKNITWISVDIEEDAQQLVFANLENDSILVTSVQSDEYRFAFAKARFPKTAFSLNATNDSLLIEGDNRISKIPLRDTESIRVTIVYNSEMEGQLKFFEVGFKAIATYSNVRIDVTTKPYSDTLSIDNNPYIIWLSNRDMPEISARTLQYQLDDYAQKLIVPGSSQTNFLLTKELTTQRVLNEQWLDQLVQWLALDQDLKATFDTLDMRTLPTSKLQNNFLNDRSLKKEAVTGDFSEWLWIIVLILMAGERFIAQLRKQ